MEEFSIPFQRWLGVFVFRLRNGRCITGTTNTSSTWLRTTAVRFFRSCFQRCIKWARNTGIPPSLDWFTTSWRPSWRWTRSCLMNSRRSTRTIEQSTSDSKPWLTTPLFKIIPLSQGGLTYYVKLDQFFLEFFLPWRKLILGEHLYNWYTWWTFV